MTDKLTCSDATPKSKPDPCCSVSTKESPSSCCPSTEDSTGKKRTDYILWGSLFIAMPLWVLGVTGPAWLSDLPWLNTMSHSVHHMIHSMWWGVAIGAIFLGVLSQIPREFILSILGRGGTTSGLLRATGAGLLLDLCNHGILMVAAKLYERGASAGQVIAFLLASPWNSFSLTLVLIGLIGLQWTLMFIVLSMVVALTTGWIFDRCVAKGILPANPNEIDLPPDFKFWQEAKAGWQRTRLNTTFFKHVMINGIRDSKMVVRWLLFGLVLAAILRVALNAEQFVDYFGPTVLGLAATIVIATVMEVCSEGAAPIGADLLSRASAPGNGFAFLMTGVATDYTEIMILKDATKSWKIALFVPLITVPQVVLIAWLINQYGQGL